MIALDPAKIQFTTTDNVDKIPVYTTQNDGQGIGAGGAVTIGAGTPPLNTDVTSYVATIPNPYGKKCGVTLSWSIDNLNFYPSDVPIYYFNATHNQYLWRALAFGASSNSSIYLVVQTQYTASQTVYLQFALVSPS